MIYFCKYSPSPVGTILLCSDAECLTGLWLEGQTSAQQNWQENESLPVFGICKQWLTGYFAGQRPSPDSIPLAPAGSGFQQRVWQELLTIPYGTTTTYGAIAKAIGCKSAQAVGGAIGKNPISILIPCHRVIGKNGSLTGYAGGLDKKAILLSLEST